MKQDERTGDSTEALRSALAEWTPELEKHRVDLCKFLVGAADELERRTFIDENCREGLRLKLIEAEAAFTIMGDILARAALSGSPAPSTEGLRGWLPIETAPRDGTGFLYFAPAGLGLRIIDAGYFDGHTFRAVNFYGDDDPTIEPTHWMPLPPAPDAARTALAAKGT